jgi:NitT/TauT family transport system substrate-binding protein
MEHVRFICPFHTVFYTPHYLALALGLFAEEGIEAVHGTASAPNGVARALQAGEVDVGLSGPIRAL